MSFTNASPQVIPTRAKEVSHDYAVARLFISSLLYRGHLVLTLLHLVLPGNKTIITC